jgi:hypothetical protein
MGRSGDSPIHYKEQMEAAGFVNVTQKIYKWPSNRWPKDKKFKELGMLSLEFSDSRNDHAADNLIKACGPFKM